MPKINSPADLENYRKQILSARPQDRLYVSVCTGTGCRAMGASAVVSALRQEAGSQKVSSKVEILESGCPGFCEGGPLVTIHPAGTLYVHVKPEDAAEIIKQTASGGKPIERLLFTDPVTNKKITTEADLPFYKNQMRWLIGDNNKINPVNIDDYISLGGYSAFVKAIQEMTPDEVINEIKNSGLRGRSGGGFTAGRKWEACRKAEGSPKYIICNCHEGDPGAFVDRRMMEANPHSIIEGMLIGAFAIGAQEGYIYVGDEYPLTVENARTAIKQAEEYGLLGENILGSGLNLTLQLSIDAGGYVFGESTALMASIEGKTGEPIAKYDHATENGLWGKPTVLNNLQTFANAPLIINEGAAKFSAIGLKNSKGTRVFSLSGAVNNCGLAEVPMGMTLRQIVYDIGGGIRGGKKFKAVQVGGPLGGFVPENALDMPVDFDALSEAGLSMGPGLIVLDETVCIIDMVRYFISFLMDESCGKCTPCREGNQQAYNILGAMVQGRGREDYAELLARVAEVQKVASLCALGRGASNTIISAFKYFRSEFDAHFKENRCPAGVCEMPSALVSR